MKKTNLLYIALILTLFAFNSCKKYEDGGSFFNRKRKLTKKSWHLTYRETENTSSVNWETINFSKNGNISINKQLIGTYTLSKVLIEVTLSLPIDTTFIDSTISSVVKYDVVQRKNFFMSVQELTPEKASFAISFSSKINTYHYEN